MWGVTLETQQNALATEFQSTPPVWGVTVLHGLDDVDQVISIHTPVWGDGTSSLSTAEGKMLKPREPEPFVLLILHQIMRVQVTPTGRAVSFTLTS